MISVTLFISSTRRKGEDDYREKNLIEVLNCLSSQTFKNFEIILVEQVFGDITEHDLKHTLWRYELFHQNVNKYIYVRNTIPQCQDFWNPCWLLNIGAKHASGNKILQLDSDIVFDYDFLQKINDNDKKAFVCWNKLYRLNMDGSDAFRSNTYSDFKKLFNKEYRSYLDIRRQYGTPITPSLLCAAGGAVCFDREFYLNKLGGRNEWFMGWGGSDNEIAHRWSTLLNGFFMLDYTIFHLYHPKDPTNFPYTTELLNKTIINPNATSKKILQAGFGRTENPTLYER